MLLCIRSTLIFATVSTVTATNIAGYTTGGTNDVTQHLRIDLDLQYLINSVSKPDLDAAYTQYSQGNNHHLREVSLFEAFFYSDFTYDFISSYHHYRWQ
jgi:hypothetical protein